MNKKLFSVFITLVFLAAACKQVDLSSLPENKDNQASPYKTVLFKKLGDTSLVAPGKVRAQLNTLKEGYSVDISWQNVEGAAVYHLYRAEDNSGVPGDFVKIAEVESDLYCDEIDLTGKGSATYHYRICTENFQGTLSAPSAIAQISLSEDTYNYTVNSVLVSDGVGFQETESLGVLASNSIQISWNKVKDAHYYKIFRYEDGSDSSTGRYVEPHYIPPKPLENQYNYFDRNSTYPTEIGVVYRYHVIPVNIRNVMGGGDYLSNQSDTGYLPPRPYDVIASQGKQGGGVDISWEYSNPISGLSVTSFAVKRSEKRNSDYIVLVDDILPGTQSYTDTTASADTKGNPKKYFYKICARYDNVESIGSEPVTGIAVSSDALCPPNSYVIRATKGNETGAYENILIKWPKITGAGKYTVYKGVSEKGPFSKLKEIAAESTQPDEYSLTFLNSKEGDLDTYEIDGLTPGKNYFFTVSCSAESGSGAGLEGAMSDSAEGFTVRVPESLSVLRNNDNTVTVAWTNPEDLTGYVKADYYQVFRSSDDVNYEDVSGRLIVSEFVDESVENGSTYYYKVAAFVTSSQRSTFTDSVSVVLMGSPSEISAEKAVTGESVTVSWTGVLDEECTGYRVYRSSNSALPEKGVGYIAVDGKDSVSYTDSSVVAGEKYYYRVSSVFDLSGATVEGNISSEFDYGFKLGTPEQVISTDGTYSDKIVVRWADVEGAEDYKIKAELVDGSTSFDSSLSPDSVDQRVCTILCPANQRYDISVAAVNSSDELGSYSDAVSGSTFIDSTLIPAPGNLSASDAVYANQVELTWTPITPADLGSAVFLGYEIYINNQLAFSIGGIETSTTLVAIAEEDRGKDLLFSVKAAAKEGESPKQGVMSDYDYGSTLGCPENVIASDGMYGDKIVVNWDNVEGAVKYQVFFRDFDGDYSDAMIEIDCADPGFDVDNPTCNFTNGGSVAEIAGKVMFFKVKAFDASGKDNVGAEDSGYILGVPANIEALGVPAFDSVTVKWDSVPNADGYRILRTQTPSDPGSWQVVNSNITVVDDNQFKMSDDSVLPFYKYYYTVQARKGAGEGFLDFANNVSGFVVSSPEIFISEYGVQATQSEAGENGSGVTVSWDISTLPVDSSGFEVVVDVVENRPGGSNWTQTISDRTISDIRFDGLVSGTECSVIANVKVGSDLSSDLEDGVDEDSLADNQKVFAPVLNSPLLTASNGAYGNSADNIDLNWDSLTPGGSSNDNIVKYVVYRSADYNGADTAWTKVLEEQENGGGSYGVMDTSSELKASAYFYKVVSVNKYGFEGLPRYIAHAYNLPPKANVLVSQDWDLLEDRIELKWTHISGVDYYVIEACHKVADATKTVINSHYVPSVNYGQTVTYNFTGIGSNPLDYGYYFFNVVPFASKKEHSISFEHSLLQDGSGQGYTDGELCGSKHMPDDVWISRIMSEIRQLNYRYIRIGSNFNSIDDNQWTPSSAGVSTVGGGTVKLWRNYDWDWEEGLGATAWKNFTFDLFAYNNATYNNIIKLTGSVMYLYLFNDSGNYEIGLTCNTPSGIADNVLKNEDWLDISGAHGGQLLMHADIVNGEDWGCGDAGWNSPSGEGGNKIEQDCIPPGTPGHSGNNTGGHGCPEPNLGSWVDSDNDGIAETWQNNTYWNVAMIQYRHHDHAFCIKRKTGPASWSEKKVYSYLSGNITLVPGSTTWDLTTVVEKK